MNHKLLTTNYKPAFTLIEILVVIGIMATLAGAIIYSTDNARAKDRDARRKHDLGEINAALVSYRGDNNNWPQITTPTPYLDYASDNTNWLANLAPTYIASMPNDPQNTTTSTAPDPTDINCNSKSFIYCYRISSDLKTFTLWAQLENTNDQQLRTNSNAICQDTPPTGSTLNYCIKSPK